MHIAERGLKRTLNYLQIIGIKCLIHVKFEGDKTGRIKKEKRTRRSKENKKGLAK